MTQMSVITTVVLFAASLQLSVGQPANKNAQIENFANLAEKMSDRQHTKYCERFGAAFETRDEPLWPKVHVQCIERMVKDGSNLPTNFPKVDDDMRKKILAIHQVCSTIVKNPCGVDDWKKVKKCIRDESFNTKLLDPNSQQGLPKNMPSISLGLASSIFDCTDKIVKSEA